MKNLNKEFTYRSIFAPHINSFLLEKKQRGALNTNVFPQFMSELDNYFIKNKITKLIITEDVILKWKETKVSDSDRTIYYKYVIWRQFCIYLNNVEIEAFIPRLPRVGSSNNYVPYIYTIEEIKLLFEACDNLKILGNKKITPMFVIPALLRMLYSTGMRISEALALKNNDVDLSSKIIHIKRTKNGYERISVINDSLSLILTQYLEFKKSIPTKDVLSPEVNFFVSQLGLPICKNSIKIWFKQALFDAGIPINNFINYPRIHDLRHTAAVHSLYNLIKEGIDIYCGLPMISVFLGHKNLKSTNQYVRLTKEAFPELIEMQSDTSFIFPSTEFFKDDEND